MTENSRTATDPRNNLVIAMANDDDLEAIYEIRHDVYAIELGQHPQNDDHRLMDSLDGFNQYIVAKIGDKVTGFISITPPTGGHYSIDKYFHRGDVPVTFDDRLYELRILTVSRRFRGSMAVPALMYGALRWIESRGGESLVAIGREGLTGLYEKAGFVRQGKTARSGAVTYELLVGDIETSRRRLEASNGVASRLESIVDWRLDTPMTRPKAAFHGGAFFDAIGREFDDLSRRDQVISADVLDAWFPPSPKVVAAMRDNLEWVISTSPPTAAEGLVASIAKARGISEECVIAGGGSSSLIYAGLRSLVDAGSKVLVLEPSYGEYAHLLENVVGCQVERFVLRRRDGFKVDLVELARRLKANFDLVVIVNPNNPTGQFIRREDLVEMLGRVPSATRFWIDETYIDFVDSKQSIEKYAAQGDNVIVCKSMSKAYALSGLRVGYLCGPSGFIEQLGRSNPPWAVSLPAQLSAVMALRDRAYYDGRYRETDCLREELANGLIGLGDLSVNSGVANFLLVHLPDDGPDAEALIQTCRQSGLFLRHASVTAPSLSPKAFRIAVKDANTNEQMLRIIEKALDR